MNINKWTKLFPVTWNVKQAKKLLTKCEMRIVVKIDGEWLELARTDLEDDVCTVRSEEALEYIRDEYLDRIIYGARKKAADTDGFGCFAVVDSLTDG